MSGITLIGNASLIGKDRNITCRMNVISQADVFQMEKQSLILCWMRRVCMEQLLVPITALIQVFTSFLLDHFTNIIHRR